MGLFCRPRSKPLHRRSAAFDSSVYLARDWLCPASSLVVALCGLLYRSRLAPFLFSVTIFYVSCLSSSTLLSLWFVLTGRMRYSFASCFRNGALCDRCLFPFYDFNVSVPSLAALVFVCCVTELLDAVRCPRILQLVGARFLRVRELVSTTYWWYCIM